MNLEGILSALIDRGAWAQAALLAFDALPSRPIMQVRFSDATATALLAAEPWAWRLSIFGKPGCHCCEREQTELARWLATQGKGSEAEILERLRAPAADAAALARKH